MMDQWALLVPIGLLVGVIGTLIGVGGGFILVPVLLLLDPKADPVHIAAISLAVVFLNAGSGSIAYLRMGRVDIKSAAWFALATLPGAILGVSWTKLIPRREFNIVFGVLMLLGCIYLLWDPEHRGKSKEPRPSDTRREITDAEGKEHVYFFQMPVGVALSVVVGCLSSMLGIGGGIIHVPVLNKGLNFPVHIATATSQVVLGFMALVGTITHLVQGNLEGHLPMVGLLGIGAIAGAQIGARLSNLLNSSAILRGLAVVLGLVGTRILYMAFG